MNRLTRFLMTAGAAAIWSAGTAFGADTTVLDGVYTAAQAQRGQAAYEPNCASCHMETLVGNPEAPALAGPRFMEVWRDDYLDGLYQHIKTRMPRRPGGDPGSLTDQQYVDIVAYIVKYNEYKPGPNELTAEAMKSTLLVGSGGPQPLGNNSLVWDVGCLTQADAENGLLTRAVEPARTHEGEETSPDELKRAEAKGLGTATFKVRLQNLIDNQPGFKPESVKGKKVLVKGALTRQPGNDRITVISLVDMGECR